MPGEQYEEAATEERKKKGYRRHLSFFVTLTSSSVFITFLILANGK
jgi:hypothetical protein